MKNIPLLYIKIASAILAFVILLTSILLILSACNAGRDLHPYAVYPHDRILPDPCAMNIINPDSELRGLWIATVQNINFPTRSNLSETALKDEIDEILENAASLGFNAIFFQVRPSADALYRSDIFPLSKYVTGEQRFFSEGDFDILEYLLDRAHHKNIRVHAWVNPLRVTAGSVKHPETDISALHPDHPAAKDPSLVRAYADGKLYFDVGIPRVRELVSDGVREIVQRYDVDGIIFDDYFYPYPEYKELGEKKIAIEFDDADTYEKYGGAYDNIGDFRRASVNDMIKRCYDAVKETDPDCLFGVAPFGIWQNDNGTNGGSNSSGLSSYSAIYCDPLAWASGGYVDYIAPQLYWRFSTGSAPYGELATWWNAALDGTGVDLYICHGAYNYETWEDIDLEMTRQIEHARELLCYKGSLLYGYAAIKNNTNGIVDEAKSFFAPDIIYTDTVSNGIAFAVTSHENGSETAKKSIVISGVSDPYYPLSLGTASISRNKNGDFSVHLPLKMGKNAFTFKQGDAEYTFNITRK